MRNQVQLGVNLTLVAPYDVLSGHGALVGNIFGIAAEDALTGATVDLVTEGVFALDKVSALAIAVGDQLYWDDATGLVTKTAIGNTLIGAATEAAVNPSPTTVVRLNGSF